MILYRTLLTLFHIFLYIRPSGLFLHPQFFKQSLIPFINLLLADRAFLFVLNPFKQVNQLAGIKFFDDVLAKLDELSLVAGELLEFDPCEDASKNKFEILWNMLRRAVESAQLACLRPV
jgi:hypothetical protein